MLSVLMENDVILHEHVAVIRCLDIPKTVNIGLDYHVLITIHVLISKQALLNSYLTFACCSLFPHYPGFHFPFLCICNHLVLNIEHKETYPPAKTD